MAPFFKWCSSYIWRCLHLLFIKKKKVREKSRECHNHKPQPFPDPKRKRKPTNLNKHKPYKRTKSTKISSLFPKRGNRNTKRTEKHKNKMTHGKTYNKSPRRINHKATRSNTWTTALERSVEQTTEGFKALLPQLFPDPKRKRKPTNPNKHKSNKRTKSFINVLIPTNSNEEFYREASYQLINMYRFSNGFICIVWIYQLLNDNKIKQIILQDRLFSTNTFTYIISVCICFVWRIYLFLNDNKNKQANYRTTSLQLKHTFTSICVFMCFVWRINKFLYVNKIKLRVLQEPISSTGTYTYSHECLYLWRIYKFLNGSTSKLNVL